MRTVTAAALLLIPAALFAQQLDAKHPTAAFSDSTKVSIIAVTNMATGKSWDMSGQPLPSEGFPYTVYPSLRKAGKTYLVIQVEEPAGLGMSVPGVIGNHQIYFSNGAGPEERDYIPPQGKSQVTEYAVPLDTSANPIQTRLDARIAAGPYKTIGAYIVTKSGIQQTGFAFDPRVVVHGDDETFFFGNPYLPMTQAGKDDNEDVAMQGIGASGVPIEIGWAPDHPPLAKCVPFAKSKSRVKSLKMLSRPLQKFSIEGIPLKPVS
jgi:hypothetical protein